MVPALGMLYPFFPRGSRDITPCVGERDIDMALIKMSSTTNDKIPRLLGYILTAVNFKGRVRI